MGTICRNRYLDRASVIKRPPASALVGTLDTATSTATLVCTVACARIGHYHYQKEHEATPTWGGTSMSLSGHCSSLEAALDLTRSGSRPMSACRGYPPRGGHHPFCILSEVMRASRFLRELWLSAHLGTWGSGRIHLRQRLEPHAQHWRFGVCATNQEMSIIAQLPRPPKFIASSAARRLQRRFIHRWGSVSTSSLWLI